MTPFNQRQNQEEGREWYTQHKRQAFCPESLPCVCVSCFAAQNVLFFVERERDKTRRTSSSYPLSSRTSLEHAKNTRRTTSKSKEGFFLFLSWSSSWCSIFLDSLKDALFLFRRLNGEWDEHLLLYLLWCLRGCSSHLIRMWSKNPILDKNKKTLQEKEGKSGKISLIIIVILSFEQSLSKLGGL